MGRVDIGLVVGDIFGSGRGSRFIYRFLRCFDIELRVGDCRLGLCQVDRRRIVQLLEVVLRHFEVVLRVGDCRLCLCQIDFRHV